MLTSTITIIAMVFLSSCQLQRTGSYKLWNNGVIVEPTTSATSKIVSSRGLCSGTLISPQHVLTAAHCVYDPRTCRQARNVQVRVGQMTATPVIELEDVHPIYRQECKNDRDEYLRRIDDAGVFGGAERPEPTLHRRRHDFAVITLEQPSDLTPRQLRFHAINHTDRWLLVSGYGQQIPSTGTSGGLFSTSTDDDSKQQEYAGDAANLREGIASIIAVDDFVVLQGPIIREAPAGQVTPAHGDSGGGVYFLNAGDTEHASEILISENPLLNGIVTGGRIISSPEDGNNEPAHESWVIDFSLPAVIQFIMQRIGEIESGD